MLESFVENRDAPVHDDELHRACPEIDDAHGFRARRRIIHLVKILQREEIHVDDLGFKPRVFDRHGVAVKHRALHGD